MKKIIINQKNSKTIELNDNDDKELSLYTKEISKIMESSKICILETTSGNSIIKPSEIISINVFELNIKQKVNNNNNKNFVKESIVNQDDVIKD